jgi:hypothetical protein
MLHDWEKHEGEVPFLLCMACGMVVVPIETEGLRRWEVRPLQGGSSVANDLDSVPSCGGRNAPDASDAAGDDTMARRLARSLGSLQGLTGAEVTSEALARWWGDLSRQVFGGKLPSHVSFEVARCLSPRSLSESHRTADGWRVRVAPHVVEYGEIYAVAQLLHEGVHVYCAAVLGDEEKSYRGHGPRFCSLANQVAATLGLAVRTREKGGKGYQTPGMWPGLWNDRPATPAATQRPREAAETQAMELGVLRARLGETERALAEARAAAVVSDLPARLETARQAIDRERGEYARELAALKRKGTTGGGKVAELRKLLALVERVLSLLPEASSGEPVQGDRSEALSRRS